MTNNFEEVFNFMSARFEEVDGETFYREIFPNNENEGEHHNDYSHPNAVYIYKDEDGERLRRRVMYKNTWTEDYMDFVECNPMALCGGLAYRKNQNKLINAQQMNALIFDIDEVGFDEINTLFLRFGGEPDKLRRLPMPTYIVLSGSGIHVYYIFKEPIDLYPNIKLQLKSLKYDLTFKMWDYKATSQKEKIEYQSINQGFRMVGSTHSGHGNIVKAFRTGKPVTLEYVNAYAQPKNRVDINKRFKPSTMSISEAKEKYPEWYQRVIVKGNKMQKKWDIAHQKGHKGDELYQWWLRQISKVKGGHRYFYLMCMVIYACKCDIPKDRLIKDMHVAAEELSKIEYKKGGKTDPITNRDIASALEAYSKEYYNFTKADVEKLTEIYIPSNKRNGRKRSTHVKIMNSTRDILYPDGEWINRDGRPKGSGEKKDIVLTWRQEHPEGKKIECHKDTGLSRTTIDKWWKYEND